MSESKIEFDIHGHKMWKNSNGELHRTDGPAVEYVDGSTAWWENGLLNRINGPAIDRVWGEKAYFIKGKLLGYNNKGFWRLWERLTDEQKKDPVLLSYLPGDFHVRIYDRS